MRERSHDFSKDGFKDMFKESDLEKCAEYEDSSSNSQSSNINSSNSDKIQNFLINSNESDDDRLEYCGRLKKISYLGGGGEAKVKFSQYIKLTISKILIV